MSTFLEYGLPLLGFFIIGLISVVIVKTVFPLYTKAIPENVDAFLYTCLGMLTAFQAGLSGETAYKYVNPYVLFWFQLLVVTVSGGALALKAYRSGRNLPPSK